MGQCEGNSLEGDGASWLEIGGHISRHGCMSWQAFVCMMLRMIHPMQKWPVAATAFSTAAVDALMPPLPTTVGVVGTAVTCAVAMDSAPAAFTPFFGFRCKLYLYRCGVWCPPSCCVVACVRVLPLALAPRVTCLANSASFEGCWIIPGCCRGETVLGDCRPLV